MIKVYLYTSSHRIRVSADLKNRLVRKGINFKEVDVAFQTRKHSTLSFIPCVIIDKDGAEIMRYEERSGQVDIDSIKEFLKTADSVKLPEPEDPLKAKQEAWRAAKTTDEKLAVLEGILGLK